MSIIIPIIEIGTNNIRCTVIIIDAPAAEAMPNIINDIVPKNPNPPIFPGNEGITPERLVIEHTIKII